MNDLPQHVYVMSEPHLSGYRVIIGYETLADAQAAQLALSKPPAREDAQPMAKPAPFDQGGIGHAMYQAFHAYRADYVLSTDGADYEPTPFERGLIEDFFAGLMAEEAFFGPVRALYDTHPAPDALRVAVESLEWAIAEIKGDTRYASEDQREAALEKAQSTLAALQAEQKGGA